MPSYIHNLELILDFCNNIRQSELSPEEQYDFVFSDKCSKKAFSILKEVGKALDYYDPDTTYEEDMDAFISALSDKIQELNSASEDNKAQGQMEASIWQKRYNSL